MPVPNPIDNLRMGHAIKLKLSAAGHSAELEVDRTEDGYNTRWSGTGVSYFKNYMGGVPEQANRLQLNDFSWLFARINEVGGTIESEDITHLREQSNPTPRAQDGRGPNPFILESAGERNFEITGPNGSRIDLRVRKAEDGYYTLTFDSMNHDNRGIWPKDFMKALNLGLTTIYETQVIRPVGGAINFTTKYEERLDGLMQELSRINVSVGDKAAGQNLIAPVVPDPVRPEAQPAEVAQPASRGGAQAERAGNQPQRQRQGSRILSTFDELDRNGDGVISRQEFNDARPQASRAAERNSVQNPRRPAHSEEVAPEQPQPRRNNNTRQQQEQETPLQVYNRLDTNRDGWVNTRTELAHASAQDKRAMDLNGNGRLDPNDLTRLRDQAFRERRQYQSALRQQQEQERPDMDLNGVVQRLQRECSRRENLIQRNQCNFDPAGFEKQTQRISEARDLIADLMRLDANSDGRLSPGEINANPETMRRLDRNNDGVVNAQDFRGILGTNPQVLKSLEKLFCEGMRVQETNPSRSTTPSTTPSVHENQQASRVI